MCDILVLDVDVGLYELYWLFELCFEYVFCDVGYCEYVCLVGDCDFDWFGSWYCVYICVVGNYCWYCKFC